MNQYQTLLERFLASFGIDASRNALSELQISRQLAQLAESQQISPQKLAADAITNREVLLDIASVISVGETYFFRHREQIDFLAKQLFCTQNGGRILPKTVWCAGCSTGEEAWSLAMAGHRQFGSAFSQTVQIIASDMNKGAVSAARHGVYGAWSFRNVPDWLIPEYFDQEENNRYVLRPRARNAVRFYHESIQDRLARTPDEQFEAVLFRNVSIYLSDESTKAVADEMVRVITPGGILIVAPTDPPPVHSLLRHHPDVPATYVRRGESDIQRALPPKKTLAGAAWNVGTTGATAENIRCSPAVGEGIQTAADDIKMPSSPPVPSVGRQISVLLEQFKEITSTGRVTEAVAFLDGQIADAPVFYFPLYLRGKFLFEQGKFEAARGDFQKAVYLNPEDELVQLWYALSLWETGEDVRSRQLASGVMRRLEKSTPQRFLSDGETTVHKALEALSLLLESEVS